MNVQCAQCKFFSWFGFNTILAKMFNLFHVPVKLISRLTHTWSLIPAPFDVKIAFFHPNFHAKIVLCKPFLQKAAKHVALFNVPLFYYHIVLILSWLGGHHGWNSWSKYPLSSHKKYICDDGIRYFPNKRLEEKFIDNNRSLSHVFVHNLILKSHTNTCAIIMKGTFATHVIEYWNTLRWKCWYITSRNKFY